MPCKLHYGFNYLHLEDDNCQYVVYAWYEWYDSQYRKNKNKCVYKTWYILILMSILYGTMRRKNHMS